MFFKTVIGVMVGSFADSVVVLLAAACALVLVLAEVVALALALALALLRPLAGLLSEFFAKGSGALVAVVIGVFRAPVLVDCGIRFAVGASPSSLAMVKGKLLRS